MKILSVSLQNFASYKSLEFNFQNAGLTLISGPTGSGKSTLCDAIPWVLFGVTAKGGPVSEVLSWPGDQVTEGRIKLELNNETIYIVRIRGKKQNDLRFAIGKYGDIIRGKDIPDTQRLINQRLGLTPDLYLAGAYFHEFSQTAAFFTATAKNRRLICEQLVDLSLPIKLQEKIKTSNKSLETEFNSKRSLISQLEFQLKFLKNAQNEQINKAKTWMLSHEKTKTYVTSLYDKFEQNRKRTVSKKCNACNTVLEHPRHVVDTSENPHLERLAELESETNPYADEVADNGDQIDAKELESKALVAELLSLSYDISDLELLSEVVADFRSHLIQNTVSNIETITNKLLSDYFDAEIRVQFTAQDADKLEVEITKDGNLASFTQLSKGQRGILKLCFGTAVQKSIANSHGITFYQKFWDEPADGLDENMKLKAFRLLEAESLNCDSMFVIEHNTAFKELFNNKYEVQLINGCSKLEKT